MTLPMFFLGSVAVCLVTFTTTIIIIIIHRASIGAMLVLGTSQELALVPAQFYQEDIISNLKVKKWP